MLRARQQVPTVRRKSQLPFFIGVGVVAVCALAVLGVMRAQQQKELERHAREAQILEDSRRRSTEIDAINADRERKAAELKARLEREAAEEVRKLAEDAARQQK